MDLLVGPFPVDVKIEAMSPTGDDLAHQARLIGAAEVTRKMQAIGRPDAGRIGNRHAIPAGRKAVRQAELAIALQLGHDRPTAAAALGIGRKRNQPARERPTVQADFARSGGRANRRAATSGQQNKNRGKSQHIRTIGDRSANPVANSRIFLAKDLPRGGSGPIMLRPEKSGYRGRSSVGRAADF